MPTVSGRLTSDEEAALQYRTRAIESIVEFDAEELATPVSEDIELDAAMPAIEDIIAVELDPYISDMRAGENKVSYKGDIVASILYLAKTERTGDEETPAPAQYVAFARKVPISGEIAVQGVTEACVPIASVKTDNLEFRPQENSLGESRTVELDFDYSVFARVFCNEENEITTDMYSTDYESAEETETLEYETVQYAKAFNFSADGSTPLRRPRISTRLSPRRRSRVGGGRGKARRKAYLYGECGCVRDSHQRGGCVSQPQLYHTVSGADGRRADRRRFSLYRKCVCHVRREQAG